MDADTALVLVKLLHTVVWAFLATCILAIPFAALAGRLRLAGVLSAIVIAEVVVLALNSMRCPLTDVAAHYTGSRGDSFDIYLPAWLARNNKRIFGTLWVLGELVLVGCWSRTRSRAQRRVGRVRDHRAGPLPATRRGARGRRAGSARRRARRG